MGYFDNEMREMLEIYLLETGQLLDQADEILLGAEKTGHLSKEDINGIFRIMHTTKSSSAMMGLDALSKLAHRLEDVFSEFRDDPARLKEIEQDAFNLIFEVTGFIRSELERMQEEDFVPETTDALLEQIDRLVLRLKESRTFAVNVRFEPNCRMEHMRAFMAARQLSGLCSSIRTYPEEVETNPDTADYIRENGVYIRFTTDKPEAVLERLSRALFVESCRLVDEIPQKEAEQTSGQVRCPQERAKGAGGRRAEESLEPSAGPLRPEGGFINVKMERLDQLQSVTEDLLIAASALQSTGPDGGYAGTRKNGAESSADRQMDRCLKELKGLVTSIRMVPFSGLVPKLSRVVRDMCQKEHKEAAFSVTGQDVEVDKAVADSMMEPLLHLIRNAVDHGIERPDLREAQQKNRLGHINLRFANLGGEISVEIEDDGAGMDLDKIREKAEAKGLLTKPAREYTRQELLDLCLLPGFSTRENTSEFSGRGVGMDIVYQTVEWLGGHIRLESEPGKGSRIRMALPLTLTIIDGIRFQAGEYSFAVPSYQVRQFCSYEAEAEHMVLQGERQYWVRGDRYIPVIFLSRFYRIATAQGQENAIIAYVGGAEHEACLVLDRVLEQGNIVEKPLPELFGKRFKYLTGIAGCSILGDGSACMLLDIESLIRASMREDTENVRTGGSGESVGKTGEAKEIEVLCIELRDSYYGIELCDISELLDSVKLSPMPCLPRWFDGICSHRGTILPVVSFQSLAGFGEEEKGRYRVVAALKGKDFECGFLTRQRPQMFRLKKEEQLKGELPGVLGVGLRIRDLYSVNGKALFVIDVDETLRGLVVSP